MSSSAIGGGITTARIGQQIPLAYGFIRATGMRAITFTANDSDNSQNGIWLLGDGEWHGLLMGWINNELAIINPGGGAVTGSFALSDGQAGFRFHRGADTPPGITPSTPSSGDRQYFDDIWAGFPGFLQAQALSYSRLAYYAVQYAPFVKGTAKQLSFIGDWATMKCRQFDSDGNQTGYGFTINPAWHFVDSWLRFAIKPDFAIDYDNGPTALTSDERSRFDWESIVDAATYFAQRLANGNPRFMGSYAFTGQTTLAAIHEQILLCCRSYQQEYAGKISLYCDKPRASRFVLRADHVFPGTLVVDEKQINSNANRYQGNFLELRLPAIAQITSVAIASGGIASIVTEGTHPCAVGDVICLGGTDNGQPYVFPGPVGADGFYTVTATPSTTQITATFVAAAGSIPAVGNYAGGYIGYPQSRFAQRSPILRHKQHQIAEGQLPNSTVSGGSRKKLTTTIDFANSTDDQVERLLNYEMTRDLGFDQTPWVYPKQVTANIWSEAVDANWVVLKLLRNGQVITIDPSLSFEYQGDYEIIEQEMYPFQGDASSPGGEPITTPDSNAGKLTLLLRSYNPDVLTDAGNGDDGSWPCLPLDPVLALGFESGS